VKRRQARPEVHDGPALRDAVASACAAAVQLAAPVYIQKLARRGPVEYRLRTTDATKGNEYRNCYAVWPDGTVEPFRGNPELEQERV
jgi:hypothetical protein